MAVRIKTLSFEGIEAKPLDVQVHMAGNNQPAFMIVGFTADARQMIRPQPAQTP